MLKTVGKKDHLLSYLLIFAFLALFGLWIKGIDIETGRQHAGVIIFSLGFVMLSAYVLAQIVKSFKLPMLTGYIFAGIIAGPYISGFLTIEMVDRLSLINDLALSFIALMAGGELRLALIAERGKSIFLSIIFVTGLVISLVVICILLMGHYFNVTSGFNFVSLLVFGVLIGVICVARSPSSAIAVIKECDAKGPFTGMILAVTIVTDVLIIIIFTIAMSLSKLLMQGGDVLQLTEISSLMFEILMSLIVGVVLGQVISFYIDRVRKDFLLFLLFIAFAVARLSMAFNHMMEVQYDISLHLEPLLICMSAGFFVQNISRFGTYFLKSLEKMSLPIYALFFSIAGASLNFDSLILCWPLAIIVVVARMIGLFGGSWLAGIISHDPAAFNRNAWMTYVTQAGVSIGLAQIAARQFPEIGMHLNTVVLAIIAINQIIGPIIFKLALNNVGESGKQ
ncbi:MAG: cation:proton antiporter [Desulfobacteraceae bacterium]|jgi:Kef-type K+ transport system membrane component KefB|nr:cation:proton antiporter [Desulfobacteraceae bacterium]